MAPQTSVETWVVAGAGRGIGAAIVQKALEKDSSTVVYAGARKPAASKTLGELKVKYGDRLQLVTLDVIDESSAQAAVKSIEAAGAAVDVLVNNAAIFESFETTTRNMAAKDILDYIGTNAVGAHLVTRAFLPLLEGGSGKTVVNISSVAGSTTRFADLIHSKEPSPLAGFTKILAGYRASKVAMNSLTVSWALDVTPDTGFKFVAVHPGSVKTEMAYSKVQEVGGSLDDFEKAGMEMLTPAESGDLLVKLIAGLTPADSGKFLDYKGNELPY